MAKNEMNILRRVKKTEFKFEAILVLLYFCVAFINALNHEMWRDELHSWSIARESTSLEDLFSNIRYEGHPLLWYLCLYIIINIFSDQLFAMQIFHLLIATFTVFIFVKFSPFNRLQKSLFAFGYFPLFEYSTICRNHGLAILFIFSFCALFKTRAKNYLALSLILFLMSQASAFGLIIAVAFGVTLFLEYVFDKKNESIREAKWGIAAIAIFVTGIALSIFQIMPPMDSELNNRWGINVQAVSTVWKSYVPIPEIRYDFWNSNFIGHPFFQMVLSSIIIGVSLLFLYRHPQILFLYGLGTFLLIMFFYSKYPGFLRHQGHLFILFIACFWLVKDVESGSGFDQLAGCLASNRDRFLTMLLLLHLVAGAYASVMDWIYPFSVSKEAAAFIKDNKYDTLPILGDKDYMASAVSIQLGRKFFYPARNREGSHIRWDNERPPEEVAKNMTEWISKKGNVLLILSYDLDPKLNSTLNISGYTVKKIKEFKNGIVRDEKYYLYYVSPKEIDGS